MRRSTSLLVWLALIATLTVAMHFMRRPPLSPGDSIVGRARVIDGDSLRVDGIEIRLSGIDAPERRQTCRDGRGRSYGCGRAAARALAAAIGRRPVSCVPLDLDYYQRTVATCTVDGIDLGETMVRAGHALDYARHSGGRYAAAEREAREARRGLWAGAFDPPERWRQRDAGR